MLRGDLGPEHCRTPRSIRIFEDLPQRACQVLRRRPLERHRPRHAQPHAPGRVVELVVRQRRWLSDREFAEGFALAQSLPGTPSGNTATYIGALLHGWWGAAAATVGFILPSFLMMIGLAIGYAEFRNLPDTERLFHGLNAAVVALILATAWRIGRRAVTSRWHGWVAAAALALSIVGTPTLEIVIVAGLVGIFVDAFADRRRQQLRRIHRHAQRRCMRRAELEQRGLEGGFPRPVGVESEETLRPEAATPDSGGSATLRAAAVVAAVIPLAVQLATLAALATIFLRVGAVTFGGGFVMIPVIQQSVVEGQHWLTQQEFADATALGQITPGPVLITATFVGYRVAGFAGALVATVAVFAPSFLMTVVAASSLRRFQSNPQVQAFLRGITPAVVGLLVAAAWSIGVAGIHTWIGLSIAVVALVVLLRFSANAFVLVFGAGLARYLAYLVLGF